MPALLGLLFRRSALLLLPLGGLLLALAGLLGRGRAGAGALLLGGLLLLLLGLLGLLEKDICQKYVWRLLRIELHSP